MTKEEIEFIKKNILPRTDKFIHKAFEGKISPSEWADRMNEVFDEEREKFTQLRAEPDSEPLS